MKKNNFKKYTTAGCGLFVIWVICRIIRAMRVSSRYSDGIDPVFYAIIAVVAFVAFIWFMTRDERKKTESQEDKSKDENNIDDDCVEMGYYKDWKNDVHFDTVKVGNQVWMAEDFENGGSKHPYIVNENNLPEGWHVPTLEEFQELQNYATSIGGSKKECANFLEKNWYRKELIDDICPNCEGCGAISNLLGGAQECLNCNGSGFVRTENVCELFWTNQEEKDGSIVCACLQKSEFSFCTVSSDSIVHLRLIKNSW